MIVGLVLLLAAIPAFLVAAYLFVLTVLSIRKPAPRSQAPHFKLDIVVPAHDEERGIAETVKSLASVDYPEGLRRILVVADNCTDGTALKAREAGASVIERVDEQNRGKGYALAFAFDRSISEGFADAVVVIDADSIASPNLLTAFSAHLERGARACQAHYGVRNPNTSWRTRLMAVALGAFHQARSLGRERLGWSCGLRGNGMCFTLDLLRQIPHEAFSIVEDLEFGIRLGRRGVRVEYVPEASVLGEMVSTEEASRSQRRRWEEGRLHIARAQLLPLLAKSFRHRSLLMLDLALDLLVPPLSQIAGYCLLGTSIALLASYFGTGALALRLFALSDAFLIAYVLRGWWLSGIGPRGLVDLMFAPPYMLWKLSLRFRKKPHREDEWVRTAREGETHRWPIRD